MVLGFSVCVGHACMSVTMLAVSIMSTPSMASVQYISSYGVLKHLHAESLEVAGVQVLWQHDTSHLISFEERYKAMRDYK